MTAIDQHEVTDEQAKEVRRKARAKQLAEVEKSKAHVAERLEQAHKRQATADARAAENVNEASPLGQALARVARLESEQAVATERVARRKNDLALILDDAASLDVDADAEAASALLLGKMSQRWLFDLAKEVEANCSARLERARAVRMKLERRLWRIESELPNLEDSDAVSSFSPNERKSRVALARWKLAVIAGDPETVGDLRGVYDAGSPVVDVGNAFRADIYEKEVHQVAGE